MLINDNKMIKINLKRMKNRSVEGFSGSTGSHVEPRNVKYDWCYWFSTEGGSHGNSKRRVVVVGVADLYTDHSLCSTVMVA